MAERLLITGGSGFIGAQVVDAALARGFLVRNLDIRGPRKAEHWALWRCVDIRHRDDLEREALDFAPHLFLHLASDTNISLTQLSDFKTTIEGTANVLSVVGKIPGLRRFLHTSTQFVVTPGVEPEDEHFLQPYTVYGEAKAEAERLVWRADLAMSWLILRPTIIWGPYHPTFASQIFRHIANGHYLHPYSRRPITRAYGYVSNVAWQMLEFATIHVERITKHVYYLGDASINYDYWADAFSVGLTGKRAKRIPVPVLRLLGRIGDAVKTMGLPAPIESGRVFRMSTTSHIDLASTHALLGSPRVSFDTGVDETLAWLRTLSSFPQKRPWS